MALGPSRPGAIFLNSPSNPTGKVLGVDHLRKVVAWARERGTIVISDECYLGLAWDAEAVSVLDPRVCDGDVSGLIAVHSLSKISNLAGYRAGFLAGDHELIAELLAVRKHAGLIVPFPVQSAMTAALATTTMSPTSASGTGPVGSHCRRPFAMPGSASTIPRRASTCGRRGASGAARPSRGSRNSASSPHPGSSTDRRAPNVRIALTATDERIAAAVARLTETVAAAS